MKLRILPLLTNLIRHGVESGTTSWVSSLQSLSGIVQPVFQKLDAVEGSFISRQFLKVLDLAMEVAFLSIEITSRDGRTPIPGLPKEFSWRFKERKKNSIPSISSTFSDRMVQEFLNNPVLMSLLKFLVFVRGIQGNGKMPEGKLESAWVSSVARLESCESEHPAKVNGTYEKSLSFPGATSINVVFEPKCDISRASSFSIFDHKGEEIFALKPNQHSNEWPTTTLTVTGSKLQCKASISETSEEFYGFAFTAKAVGPVWRALTAESNHPYNLSKESPSALE